LGIEVAYNAAGQVVGRVGGIMYPSVRAATVAVLDETPALKLVLGNFADKLIIAAEKINQTAIGQAVSKVEAALLEQEAKLLGRFGIKSGSAKAELARHEECTPAHITEHGQELVSASANIKVKTDKEASHKLYALNNEAEVGKKGTTALQIPTEKSGRETVTTLFKPLKRGSTGRAIPNNLNEQLALSEIMSAPEKGRIMDLKKGMTDPRWPQSKGWVKMHYYNADCDIEIHYVVQLENGTIKAIDDFKFKDLLKGRK